MQGNTDHGYPAGRVLLHDGVWWVSGGTFPRPTPFPSERVALEAAPEAGFAEASAALQAADANPLLGDLHSPWDESVLAKIGRFTCAEVAAPWFMTAFVARAAFSGCTSKGYAQAIHAFGFSVDLGIVLASLLTVEEYEDADFMRRLAWATAGLLVASNDMNGPVFGTVFRRMVGLAVERVREECAAFA